MTKGKTRPDQDTGALKTLLIVGTIAATLAGTRLLARNENSEETAVPTPNPVIIIEPAPRKSLPLPPNANGGDQAITLNLAPVPQAVTPNINPLKVQVQQARPVARTKSS